MPVLSFKFKNFHSFKEGVEIPFVVNEKCPSTISKGLSFITVLGLKGANASGKTNILKALNFLCQFAASSFLNDVEKDIPISSYNKSEEPVEFEIEFSIEKKVYRFQLVVNKSEVKSEILSMRNDKGAYLIVAKRIGNKLTKVSKDYEELKKIVLPSKASMISASKQNELKVLKDIYDFFKGFTGNVGRYGWDESGPSLEFTSKWMNDDAELLNFVKSILRKCDVGISDIKILNYEDKTGEKKYFPLFEHPCNDGVIRISDLDESSGTVTIFKYLALYWYSIKFGTVLIMDEIDNNLHPMLLPLLIELFDDVTINTRYSQLIFTTHDAGIMDTLGKYRVFIVNKEGNESFGYRLDSVGGEVIRNDRPISPIYVDKRLGGVPRAFGSYED